MICLDNSDTLEGGCSVDAVVDCTVHGLVSSTFTNLYSGQLSNTDPSVLYTAGAAISVVSVTMVNTHSSAVTVNLYLDPANGGNPRRLIPENVSLGIGYSLVFDGQRISIMDTTGGIITTTSYGNHASNHTDGTDDIQSATNAQKGVATAAQITAIEANTSAQHTQGTDTALGTMAADIDMNNTQQVVSLQAPAASGEAIRQTANVTETNLNTLTGGGDTTLHDHDGISENTAARHAQSHTVASHNDTTATGAELETLTDNSIADALHRHSELVASDGSPDPALSVAADGKASFPAGTGINEFSTDGTLAGDSDDAVPTEKAVATAINTKSDNILINQDFSIWQDNTTFTNPGNTVYTADGYYVHKVDGGGTAPSVNVKKNTSVQEDAFEQTMELEITNVGSVGAGRWWAKRQTVKDYKKYRGKTLTLSIRIKASITINIPGGQLHLSDDISGTSTPITSITTSWTTYSVTDVIATNATAVSAYFAPLFSTGEAISTTGSIYIQWMKLELGSVATPLIPRRDDKDLDLCQRNYQKTYLQSIFPGAVTEVGAVWQEITAVASADHTMTIDVKFPKVMEAPPTVTLYDLAGNSGRVTMAAGNNIVGTVSQISDSGFKISATNGAVATSRKIAFHYTAISRV